MYAQLCLRLNNFTSQTEDQDASSFRKLLLHKCQEEFKNRRRAASDPHQNGLSPEEEEQVGVAKRKMLGNIKFVGELYKFGILHEAIIHNCIKELLERKKGQSIDDTSKSIECLCHFLTTVGNKLDTDKAKGWMDQYFDRMQDLSVNKDFPSRIKFMLMDVIELRESKWVPRRAMAESGPRPIHLIRTEVYKEKQSAQGGWSQTGPHPPPPLDFNQQRFKAGPQYAPPPGPSGDEGFTSDPYVRDHLLSPQDHAPMTFVPHSTPPLLQTPAIPAVDPDVGDVNKPSEKKNVRKLPSKKDNTVSLRPSMKSLKLGSAASRAKMTTPTLNIDQAHSDSPMVADGNEKPHNKKPESSQKTFIPRTRDDSSDEEDRGGHMDHPALHHHQNPPLLAHAPLPPHSYPSTYPPLRYPPPLIGHMMPPRGPDQFYPRGGHGSVGVVPMMPLIRPVGGGLLPHQMSSPMVMMNPAPPTRGGVPPRVPPNVPISTSYRLPPGPPPMAPSQPPHGYFGPLPPPGVPLPPQSRPYVGMGPPQSAAVGPYGPPPRMPVSYPNQVLPMPSHERPRPPRPHSEHEVEKPASRPPNLERNEPVIKYKSGKKSSGSKKTAQNENEKLVDPIIINYLKLRDMEKTLVAIKQPLKTLGKETLCTLFITGTLQKSEDERTHMSNLLQELQSRDILTSAIILKAFTTAINSPNSQGSQNKTYLAGFIARAVAQDILTLEMVGPLFHHGAHHPTVLVILQALTSLLGENEVLKRFQESDIKLALLLPLEFRSHSALSELVESKHLGFLYPLKRIQVELSAKLSQDSSTVSIYKWIKGNVDPSLYPTAEFVMVLTRCILERVTSFTLSPSTSRSENPSKELIAMEKKCMLKFKILVEKFVSESISLQVCVLYATQVFCHDKQFPKGLLLRMFSYLYDMDVIEEESFFKWKEDISQEFPGKGQALFQVNQWLVMLAEADEEEGSSGDEN